MPLNIKIPPSFDRNFGSIAWQRFFHQLMIAVTRAQQIFYTDLNFTGSNLTSLLTRNHSDLQNINAAGSHTSDAVSHTPAGTGAVATTVQAKLYEVRSFADYGAVGDGVTDDAVALAKIAALASGTIIDGGGLTYGTNTAIVFNNKIWIKNATIKALASFPEAGIIARFNADDCQIDIGIDGGGIALTGVAVVGDNCKGTVTGTGITGSATGGGTQSVLYLIGENGDFSVHGHDLVIGTSTNPSIPRVLSTAPTSKQRIRHLSGNDIQCMWTNQDGIVDVDFFSSRNCGENGLYDVGTSGSIKIGTMIFHGNITGGHTQTLVIKGKCSIGSLFIRDCDGYAAVDSTGNLDIGYYHISTSTGAHTHQAIVSRAGTTTANVAIGELYGEYRVPVSGNGGAICQFFAGTIANCILGKVSLILHWDTGDTKNLLLQTNGTGARMCVGELDIELVDDSASLTSADLFTWAFPAYTLLSYINKISLRSSSGLLQVTGLARTNILTPANIEIDPTTGWHDSSMTSTNPRRFFGSAAPTGGTYRKGDIVEQLSPSGTNDNMWVCTVAGTPGTWVAYTVLTTTNHTDLTDGGDSSLHYHAADRNSANFTGTPWTDLTDGGVSTAHTHVYRSASPTDGVGYKAGAGGLVTQLTSKSTGVTLNNACGTVVMHNAALAANTTVSFTLTNSVLAATDTVLVNVDGFTTASYQAWAGEMAAGSCVIAVRNETAGSLSDAIVVRFAVIKTVQA